MEDLCHVYSGGQSLTYVPSRGWGKRGGALPWGCSMTHVPVGDGGSERATKDVTIISECVFHNVILVLCDK